MQADKSPEVFVTCARRDYFDWHFSVVFEKGVPPKYAGDSRDLLTQFKQLVLRKGAKKGIK